MTAVSVSVARVVESELSDTLHVQFQLLNPNEKADESYTISLEDPGDPKIQITSLPTSFSLVDNNIPITKDIAFIASNLVLGDNTIDIQVLTPPGKLTETGAKKIQIIIHVNECTASVPTCFFTDSDGNFLTDCEGEIVSANEGGTFMLVNKKNGVIVATNPGQFYYNYLWTNDGQAADVQVKLGGLTSLEPRGANAVHAYTFDTSGFTQNIDAFDMVNNDGSPCGPYGPCTVNLGSGETLWVTWHLNYSEVGQSKPGASDACHGDEPIEASAYLVDTVGKEIAGECSASATGYNKR